MPDLVKRSWTFVCLESIMNVGITIYMVSNIAMHEDQRSYKIVTTSSCVESLSTQLEMFDLKREYEPLVPAANKI
jgi:hypothetical protein